MPVKDADILKHLLLKEEENETLRMTFEDDPMGFILKKYPGLNEVMEYMMTKDFKDYLTAIFIVAPKPTTFKVILHNGQYFFLQFMGKAYQATVLGKNYYLMSIGEKERCMLAIARLLRYGLPIKTKGPESGEEGTRPEGETEETPAAETGEETAAPEAGGEETTVTESRILQSILKKSLFEKKEVAKNPEKEIAKVTKSVINKILNDQKAKDLGLTSQSQPNRIGNISKISSDQFVDLIKGVFGEKTQVAVYKPGQGPNVKPKGSSKFNMFEFSPDPDSVSARIILAGGANEGEKFETSIFNSLKNSAGQKIEDIEDPIAKQLYQETRINPENLSPSDIKSTGRVNTNRSLDWDGPQNVGETISDVTIKDGEKNNYLSIKNKDGGTFYNGGTIPFIVEDEKGNFKYEQSKRGSKKELDRLFTDLGIDPNKIVLGLQQYKKEGAPSEYTTALKADSGQSGKNLEDFKKFLASGYGYGYWYVRQKKDGSLFIKELKDKQDALNMVGDITEVQIKYPGPNTKSTTIKVITADKDMIDTDYVIELRNEKGGIVPLSVKMKSTK